MKLTAHMNACQVCFVVFEKGHPMTVVCFGVAVFELTASSVSHKGRMRRKLSALCEICDSLNLRNG